MSGMATGYEMRWSFAPINAYNWFHASSLTGLPRPGPPWSQDTVTVQLPITPQPIFIAMRTQDAVGNWSGISNNAIASTTLDATSALPAADGVESVGPIPALHALHVRLALARRGSCDVAIFDALGRRVRALASGEHDAGLADLTWDLHDDRGARVEPWLYLVRARFSDLERTMRAIFVGPAGR